MNKNVSFCTWAILDITTGPPPHLSPPIAPTNMHDKPKAPPQPSEETPATDDSVEISHHLYSATQQTDVDNIFDMSSDPISPQLHNQHNTTSNVQPPAPLPVDKANSSLPKVTTMPQHMLQKSIGHLNTDLLQKHMHELGTKSVQIQRINTQLHKDPGQTATMQSNRRNTTPSPKPKNYSDIWHINIGFGPCTAIGGIRYTLMAVDKKTKLKLVYGLKNLTTSLR